MTTTPTVNPQIIGQAENAHKPLMARVLAPTGLTFHQWVTLNLTAANGGTVERELLVGRLTGALKIDDSAALQAITGLIDSALLEAQPATVELTDAGQARYREIRASIDEVMARVYRDIPAEDLAAAGRVLTLITARLNAEAAA
ncbi:hypothetical protein F0L68_04580 [Solihabitans fulvus]|uniref:HTH marR-type domain-containing protein n=1 Tax=Solihabitans fulvus TaxID=1892852 RepID=A0A5B2XPP0_9PSEU|nr:hypothetical protein [Solihabitans fulvus]KAA2265356.1 hypothetical protein F0L68_04580 [Solihabitans fulvus]